MRLTDTSIRGLVVVDVERIADARGYFTRAWCAKEFSAYGISVAAVQENISYNVARGTLRGMHFQRSPSREGKLVRCSRGEIFDVAVDLRCDSTTYLQSFGIKLSAADGRGLYIPPGMAHGFMTLEPDSEVHYLMTDEYRPDLADGVRWNDPAFAIRWPLTEPAVIADRDRDYPDFKPAAFTTFQGY